MLLAVSTILDLYVRIKLEHEELLMPISEYCTQENKNDPQVQQLLLDRACTAWKMRASSPNFSWLPRDRRHWL